ncbi:MAG: hypothetical protein IPJ89_05105 [Candidatus Iainarchaeum archaeon]|uniref:MarR family transcriptional regulator n=1 Tax=Candidatus Iainarchaeum sp. TaxID=3101447 RepID=A0A7T9I1K0_9ARCH|nr:MAG: hypothetical protein IPJ89_05105 [Candidatus Diapherotrites archaeon]
MNLKEKALFEAVQAFESIGFTSLHARVLLTLKESPLSIREVARQSNLFQYDVRATVQDLLGLDLIEYTRKGVQVADEWEMLQRLMELCEDCNQKKAVEFEAAFEVVHPKVIALKKHWDFEG